MGGINFDGLNPESVSKLQGFIADGELTQAEKNSLTQVEKEALANAFSINLDTEGDIKLPSIGEEPVPLTEEAKKPGVFKRVGNWFKDEEVPTWKKVAAGVGAVAAVAVAGVAAVKLGAFAAIGKLFTTGAGKALAGVGVAMVAASCVSQYTNINEGKGEALLLEIIALLKQKEENDQARHEKLMTKFDTLITEVGNVETAIQKLYDMGADISDIVKLLKDKEYGLPFIADQLSKLTGAVLDEEGKSLLDKVLTKLDKLDSNDQELVGLLNDIIDKLAKGLFDENEVSWISQVLTKLDNMSADIACGFLTLANGQKLSQEQLNTIINNQGKQIDQNEYLRKLIMENNEIAKGTQDAVNGLKAGQEEILDQIKTGNSTAKEILDKISAGTATLDEMKELLKGIKTGVDNNTLAIGDIKQFVNIIGSAIEKLLSEVQGIRAETQQGLLAILAKIPNGCNCQPTDLSKVLELLNKLLEEIQKDPSDNTDSNPNDGEGDHEGILKDLEDYFN